ncbi:2'-5'-oligoadenylate synthase 1A-like [Mytilus trossulus]|uniref:2'-5'-oligoadenylate synthase 1A-like n=1 Tax=Mytilus trossulus TaxID=6551 RepID=UPI003006EC0C
MGRQFSWTYRMEHPTEFPYVCDLCKPANRRFKKLLSKESHDKMTSRHGRVSVQRQIQRSKINKTIDLLLPDENYRHERNAVIKRIGNILKNNVPLKYQPAEVITAGSTGKGTALKGSSDVDIVFDLPARTYNTVSRMLVDHTQILDDIKGTLIASGYTVTGRSAKALQLRVTCNEPGSGRTHYIDVDILPAANLEKYTRPEIFQQMRDCPVAERKFFTPSLTKTQRGFVKSETPAQLKRLIQYVKHWKTSMIKVKSPPSSYSFELLAIYLWQQDGKPQTFKIENGLRRVMEKLADYQSIKVEFFEYYNHNMHQRHIGPHIIDPVNPFSNVLDVSNSDWSAVALNARNYLQQADMRNATSRFCDL